MVATVDAVTPLIIDTDPGVDDAFALGLAVASPEAELLAVTTVFGNVPLSTTTENARRLLTLFGRPDVPVAAGAARPLVYPHPHEGTYAHGSDGLSGRAHTLPPAVGPTAGTDAVSLILDVLDRSPRPVTIAAVGPLTNIALLLAAHPGAAERIGRLVVMGGGLSRGNTTAAAEFNVWSDPEAAHRVLAVADVPTTLVPIDLTLRCEVDRAWLDRLAAGGPVGATLAGLTDDYVRHYSPLFGRECTVPHDAIAVAEAIRPGTLGTERYPVQVECSFGPARGATVVDRRPAAYASVFGPIPGRSIDVAVDTDADALREHLLTRLSSLPVGRTPAGQPPTGGGSQR